MRYLLRILSITGLLAFIGVSTTTFLKPINDFGPAYSPDPLMTANHFLLILGVDQPASRVERALNEFPPDAHFLLIAPESEPFVGQTRLTLIYLAYPRKLSAVICSGPGKGRITEPADPAAIDGFLFFETKVNNPGQDAVSIGSKLIITRQKSTAAWQSYCQ